MPQNVLICLFWVISVASSVISPAQRCPSLELEPEKVKVCRSFKMADARGLQQKVTFKNNWLWIWITWDGLFFFPTWSMCSADVSLAWC